LKAAVPVARTRPYLAPNGREYEASFSCCLHGSIAAHGMFERRIDDVDAVVTEYRKWIVTKRVVTLFEVIDGYG
jgi:hypothetical protein